MTTIGEKININFFLPILEDKAPPKGAKMIPDPAAVAANHDPEKCALALVSSLSKQINLKNGNNYHAR